MRYFLYILWSNMTLIIWPALKEQLAKHPAISISAAVGPTVVSIFVVVNPILQFMGLIFGLFLAILTAEAKLEERKERKAKKVHPDLIEKLNDKHEKAVKLNGKHK